MIYYFDIYTEEAHISLKYSFIRFFMTVKQKRVKEKIKVQIKIYIHQYKIDKKKQ